MSNVAIEKVPENGSVFRSLIDETENVFQRIRNRAFELFQRRGESGGSDLDDWLRAEREMLVMPNGDLAEKDGSYEVKLALPGFEAKELRLMALPDALVLSGESKKPVTGTEGNVQFRGVEEKKLFRRIDFPAAINQEKVEAQLDKGVLYVTAPRLDKPAPKPIPVAAAA
jgi:HSP20 family molecular chaperone IbpA